MKLAALIAAVLLVAAPAFAGGDPNADPDAHLMRDYTITMPKLKAYDAAYLALTTAAKADKTLKADLDAAASENDQTLKATIGKMDHHPRVYAFFQKQGLNKTEASLLPLILMGACTAAQYPQALKTMGNMVSPSQANFCKANMAAIKGLHFMNEGH